LNPSREDLFRELGLSPVWRLKTESRQASAPGQAVALPIEALMSVPDETGIMQMDWPRLVDAIRNCTRCGLHRTRKQGVPGVGDQQAEWLIIGEAPGAEEDAQGEPFVGQAGKLLDAMLAAIGLKRGENVYIANVLKSRPPGNRNPSAEEVAACLPYLERQIQLIQPKLILALGRFATQSLLNSEESIGRLRGRVHRYQGVPLIVSYHPAYLLRNLPDKAKAWEDLCLAREVMGKAKAGSV
jgi:uracil-DNA glycosylase family 4